MDGVTPLELVIARHGNTFDRGDTVLRCGARTDLPLSRSGREQAQALGRALVERYPGGFRAVHASGLRRTQQTAALVLEQIGQAPDFEVDERFTEIDYGPDEGRPESEVRARLGEAALAAWDDAATVPPGWHCDPAAIERRWVEFLEEARTRGTGPVLVVTSNGIARFASSLLTGTRSGGKLRTGAFGVLVHDGNSWQRGDWDVRPVS